MRRRPLMHPSHLRYLPPLRPSTRAPWTTLTHHPRLRLLRITTSSPHLPPPLLLLWSRLPPTLLPPPPPHPLPPLTPHPLPLPLTPHHLPQLLRSVRVRLLPPPQPPQSITRAQMAPHRAQTHAQAQKQTQSPPAHSLSPLPSLKFSLSDHTRNTRRSRSRGPTRTPTRTPTRARSAALRMNPSSQTPTLSPRLPYPIRTILLQMISLP